ncbi:xylulokinase [Amylibacter ulvae]|uniref:Xylulose kinase n=1 Tax=Paramylibacter ulvae TaxID=1651968 RepID=A0ABQ3D4Q0_9RHOB|nr:xylulokinase [Amylibacter ulvae]GHA58723.1 xylulokinase [Amylibacter ulvae]
MYLGLDLGTSGLKALIVDENGAAVATAHAQYDVSQPHPNWSEQDPNEWVIACLKVFTELDNNHGAAFQNIRAISMSGHMHGAVVVDTSGKPLRPCILWNDMRSEAEAKQLDADPNFRKISGNIVFPGFTAPKLMWMQKHEPDLYDRIHKVILPKDFLLHWLTKRYVTDMSDAAGSSWLDVGARDWSETLLNASGMRMDQMPDLIEGSQIAGIIDPTIAHECGFNQDVKVIAGGADNAVAACGVGAAQEGQGFVSLGTSGVLLAAKNGYHPAPETAVHTFCHAVPERWYQMAVMLSATNSLNWLANTLNTTPAQLSKLCAGPISGPSKITFLPYLTGERTPHNDADIGGAFIGLKSNTTPADLCQSVMEGVSFALRDCLEALKSTGTELHEILAIGGGSKSEFWIETLATILNLRLALPDKGDFGAALGAARLAMIGDGADVETTLVPPAIAKHVSPNKKLQSEYEAAYQRFKKLYPLIKEAS